MNAIQLAERLEAGATFPAYPPMPIDEATSMLRRQHEAIVKLREALEYAFASNQWDPATAIKMLDALKETEIFTNQKETK